MSDSANTQFSFNRTAAINTLSLSDGFLQSVTSLLQDAQTTVLDATSQGSSSANRSALATHLKSSLQELLGLANSTDGTGNYLYAGGQGGVQPFAISAGGVVYQGDDVLHKVQAAPSRQIPTSDSGADIFMRIKNGNGTFQATPATANTGSGIVSQGVVLDATLYNANTYQVSFSVAPGGTTYSINDTTSGAPVALAVPYVSGQAITFNGIQFDIKGAPANGDKFNVSPSGNQSIFDTIDKLITTLTIPIPTGNSAALAVYQQGLNNASAALGRGLDTVLGVRATIGSRLNELDALQLSGDSMGLQYKQTLSRIQDTDYTKAISDLTQQNMNLQAAQQTFAKVANLSLFSYLN
jgi:flagellar hook-associated protein 3 FlgL